MKTIPTIISAAMLGSIACSQDAESVKSKIENIPNFPLRLTIRVADERGTPVQGAHVNVGFFDRMAKDLHREMEGFTDAKGEFSTESETSLIDCPIKVTKEGYYFSRLCYRDVSIPLLQIIQDHGFKPPHRTVDVMLKKIGNPIPMYFKLASDTYTDIPGFDEDYSFDLLAWDWLPPHGNGITADWTIRARRDQKENRPESATVTIRFANPHDGMIPIEALHGPESVYPTPRLAPDHDYKVKKIEIFDWKHLRYEDGQLADNPAGFFLRLRTQVAKSGTVTSCLYGIIVDTPPKRPGSVFRAWGLDLKRYMPQTKPRFGMSGILINPNPMDRNLEHDPFKTLYPEPADDR